MHLFRVAPARRQRGRAGDEGAAAPRQPDDRQGVHDDRLHGRPARRARRRLRGEHRRHERAAADATSTRDLVAEIAFSKAERLQWPSKDGTVDRRLADFRRPTTTPAKGPYPLIVVSHGGPHAATGYSFDFKKQFFAANGYFVLDTNFRSSTGYGDAFKWATWGEWGKKDGEDVISGIDYVLKRYPIDPKRVGHIGHSYGGFMTQLADHAVSGSLRRGDHRRRASRTGSATTARPTSIARRRPSSSARRGTRTRATG